VADERRTFLKRSILGGLATAFLLPSSIDARTEVFPAANECQGITAADLLAMFSDLAWRLPNQLKAAVEAAAVENKIYKDFDTLYRELVDLAKQLNLKCDSTAQQDPRLREILDLTKEGQNNVRYITSPSSEERDIAYLQLVTLTTAARQVGRSANEILPDNIAVDDPDNKIICQMLGKINEMQDVKMKLDVARKNSQNLFKSFTDSLSKLNKTMLRASDSAAKADRGEIGTEKALQEIDDAERILKDLAQQSLAVHAGMITPQQLGQLIAVPKAMIKKELPTLQTSQRSRGDSAIFQNVSYDSASAVDSDKDRIERIIKENVWPMGSWLLSGLAATCLLILKTYADEEDRRGLINNALQIDRWADPGSNYDRAASAIAKLKV